MAQPAYISPRPSQRPSQSRRTPGARRSSLFRPPQSPSTPSQKAPERRHASFTPHYASATSTSTSRKRSRPDHQHSVAGSRASVVATPQSDLESTWAVPSLENSAVRSDFASPEPFVNTKYNLAGGLDTPGIVREYCSEKESQDDFGVRRRWRESDHEPLDQSSQHHAQQRRRPSSSNGLLEQQSWTQFVFGVAGKVWQFGSSAFQGFYAGGGKGYAVHTPAQEGQPNSEGSVWESMQDSCSSRFERGETPLPGSYPADEDDAVEYDQRPAKRMHVEGGDSPWVLVQNPTSQDGQRKRTLHKPPPPPRPTSHTRRSLVPVSRRTTNYHISAGSPALQQPQRPASYAHQRSSSDVTPSSYQSPFKESPLSPEAQKYLLERRREEKQQDASIRRMNEQLKALLKEGRQALGTKVEVLEDGGERMDVEDEGYFEDGR